MLASLYYLTYPFAWHALIAATLTALASGLISPLIALRRMAFVVHSTSELAFTGAVVGLLIANNPVLGAFLGAVAMTAVLPFITSREEERDPGVGVLLALGIALGVLALSYYRGFATAALGILFGQIFSVTTGQIALVAVVSFITAAVALLIVPRVVFLTLEPELASLYRTAPRLTALLFVAAVVFSATAAAQVVGTILVLSLSVAPGATAVRIAPSFKSTILLSMILAVLIADGGLLLALVFPTVKPSVFIASLAGLFYAGARVWASRLN